MNLPVFRSRRLVLLFAIVLAVLSLIYWTPFKNDVPTPEIRAETFNQVLQERAKEKATVLRLDPSSYEQPMVDLIISQAQQYGIVVEINASNWQKADIHIVQGDPELLVEWLSDLDVLYGIRIQNLHVLSINPHEFAIDRLVVVR